MMTQRLMQMLGAAIVLIALSLAPSVAKAHSGHEHHVSAHSGHAHAAFHPDLAKGSINASAKGSVKASTKPSIGRIASKLAAMPLAPDRNCVGDCCSAACAACCAAGLPDAVHLVPFAPIIKRVAFAPTRAGASRGPESIRRPPKSSI